MIKTDLLRLIYIDDLDHIHDKLNTYCGYRIVKYYSPCEGCLLSIPENQLCVGISSLKLNMKQLEILRGYYRDEYRNMILNNLING